ncbi:MAG: hypothetical protein QXK47_04865 [Candidatus Bathyarchaeia archaeon]
MREVVYDFEDFKARVDMSKPLHHDAYRKPLDRHGIYYRLRFRIYGLSKDGGHVLVFENHADLSTLDIPKEYQKSNNAYENLNVWCKALLEKFEKEKAEPLGSTPGRWEV